MFKMKINHRILVTIVAIAGLQPPARAQSTIDLQSAGSFAVLGSSAVSNTGPTTVYGDLGAAQVPR